MSVSNVVSVKSAAEILGVSEGTIRQWENDGKIKSFRTEGGHRRFVMNEIISIMNKEKGMANLYYKLYFKEQKDKEREGFLRIGGQDLKASILLAEFLFSINHQKKCLEALEANFALNTNIDGNPNHFDLLKIIHQDPKLAQVVSIVLPENVLLDCSSFLKMGLTYADSLRSIEVMNWNDIDIVINASNPNTQVTSLFTFEPETITFAKPLKLRGIKLQPLKTGDIIGCKINCISRNSTFFEETSYSNVI